MVAGLGGVRGVQQRLVAGPGWARVGSWVDLELAVDEAGPGASAVVLVSYAGDRAGHAVALHVTDEGLRWVDPAGSSDDAVRPDRPATVERAVAAWAVVVRPGGRVAAPGEWSAPESAGAVGVLTDAPVRHDFAAMGVEIEQHNVRLFLPPRELLENKTWLLRSRDELVQVVVDANPVWLSEDGDLYDSQAAMEAAGASPHPEAGDTGEIGVSVPEVVTKPWRVLDEPRRRGMDEVLRRIRDLEAYWGRAPVDMSDVPDPRESLAGLFRDSDYEVNPQFRHVRVVRLGDMFGDAPLYVQPSVGVPLGGGVLAALADVLRGNEPGSNASAVLGPALRFGWRVASDYADAAAGASTAPGDSDALAPDWDVADVIMVVEVMALAFGLVTGLLTGLALPASLMKSRIPVVARHDLSELRAELEPRVHAFLAGHVDRIRELFAEEFEGYFPYPQFARAYNTASARPPDSPVEIWALKFTEQHTVGQLFDRVLRPSSDDERIDQEDLFEIGRADSGGLDRRGGREPGVLPLVVLELRELGRSKYGPFERPELRARVDYPVMKEILGEVAGMVRRGEAAAEFARRLPATEEGRLVVASLRQAAAAAEGTERESAARILRQAAGQYLSRSPGEAEALEMTLGPLAEQFGMPGRLDADSLPTVLPELPSRWAEVADHYETAYEAVRDVARDVALPTPALRWLVSDLTDLAIGGYAVEYLPEVLGNPDILRLLGSIGRTVPVRGGAKLTRLVNDLLVAASLVPVWRTPAHQAASPGQAAREGLRPAGLISPHRLAYLLRGISEGLAGGRDPLAAPVLAGASYQADAPLAVRLARLALLNLSESARQRLAADPLFGRLLNSRLLGDALSAASGAEEQFFSDTGPVAAVDQVLLSRMPTIAGLLMVGRDLVSGLQGQAAGGGGLLQATVEFAAIAAEADAVLDAQALDPGEAGERLRELTPRWAEAMRTLDEAAPPGPGRAIGIDLDDDLAPVNVQLDWPVLPPTRLLAEGLVSEDDQARFWDLVRGEGGVLVRTGADQDRRVLYLRAARRGVDRVFAFGNPDRSTYGEVTLRAITDWARSQAAVVHGAYLPSGSPEAGTPIEVAAAARGAAERAMMYLAGDPEADLRAGQQRQVLLSLLGGPPLAGEDFRRTALTLLRAADDRELGELFRDGGELLALLSARIPEGDSLRGELDGLIGSRFRGGRPALVAGTVQPTGQPPREFSPGFLDARLEGVEKAGPLSEQDVPRIIGVMSRAGSERMIRQLGRLSVVQRARAARWVARAQIQVRAHGAGADSGEALNTLEALEEGRAAERLAEGRVGAEL
jgi:hypothetical protein